MIRFSAAAFLLTFAFLSCACAAHAGKVTPNLESPDDSQDPELVYRLRNGDRNFAGCFPSQSKWNIRLQTIDYKDAVDSASAKTFHLRAYVFSPPTDKPNYVGHDLPAVVMFHGGAWQGCDPTYWFPQALYLASRGAVTITFQYRLEEVHGKSQAPNPNMAERASIDARSAMLWVKENADRLGIDIKNVAVTGDSAGGHLALITSLIDKVPGEPVSMVGVPFKPKAIVALYPVVDTENLDDGKNKPKLNFPDVSPKRLAEKFPDRLPPTEIIFGHADDHPWTTPDKTVAFCKKLSQCQADFIAEPPGNHEPLYYHGFMAHPVQYKRMMTSMDAFLTRQGVLAGDPNQSVQRVNRAADLCISTMDNIFKWSKEFGYANHGGNW